MATEKLARIFGGLMGVAEKLCKGVKRKKFYPPYIVEVLLKGTPEADHKKLVKKFFYYELEYDSAMTRFLLERFLPAARQGIDINIDSPEEFYRALAAARATPQQKPPIETKALPEPESDQRH
jgi:hypothetical protein